ncbi:hypothetical protein D9M71_326880 [compost metagenome]
MRKNFCCTYRYLRDEHDIPGFFGVHGGEDFAHALGESGVPTHENRNVGAQFQAHRGQLVLAAVKFPEMVEPQQRGGRIGTATTDPAAHGQDFFQPDVGAKRAAGKGLQLPRGPHDQIAFVGDVVDFAVQANFAIFAQGERQFVTEVEELKQCLQLVITVGATPENVQHQVELGRCGQGQGRLAHVSVPVGEVANP